MVEVRLAPLPTDGGNLSDTSLPGRHVGEAAASELDLESLSKAVCRRLPVSREDLTRLCAEVILGDTTYDLHVANLKESNHPNRDQRLSEELVLSAAADGLDSLNDLDLRRLASSIVGLNDIRVALAELDCAWDPSSKNAVKEASTDWWTRHQVAEMLRNPPELSEDKIVTVTNIVKGLLRPKDLADPKQES